MTTNIELGTRLDSPGLHLPRQGLILQDPISKVAARQYYKNEYCDSGAKEVL